MTIMRGCLHLLLAAGILLLGKFFLAERPPLWVEWKEKTISLGDDLTATLSKKTLVITGDEDHKAVFWQSESNWKVQDVFVTDLDLDGEPELGLLVWKIGRYGKHRPFWIEKNEDTWSQHIFLYDVEKNVFPPKWFASDIGREVHALEVVEDGDIPVLLLTDGEGEKTAWIWSSFGLKNIEVRADG